MTVKENTQTVLKISQKITKLDKSLNLQLCLISTISFKWIYLKFPRWHFLKIVIIDCILIYSKEKI